MLKDHNAAATLGVKDMERARRFYVDVLGLEEGDKQGEGAQTFHAGRSSIFAYVSDFAGTNEATAVTFDLGDQVSQVVEALKAKGATFEHYDQEGMTLEGDVHVGYGMKIAWLKDPDGNIFALAGR